MRSGSNHPTSSDTSEAGDAGFLRVLHILPWIDIGGSDRASVDGLIHSSELGILTFVVTTQESPNRWLRQALPYAHELWHLPDLMPASAHGPFLLGLVESRGIGVVHVMNSRLGFDLLPALKRLSRPPATVVQMHAEEGDGEGYPRYVAELYEQHVDAFCPISAHLADRLRHYGVPPEKLHVIPVGVTLGAKPPSEGHDGAREIRILFPARLAEEKDPLLLVAATSALASRGLPFTVSVLGGPLERSLRDAVRDAGLSKRFRFLGPVEDLAAEYPRHDIAILTSRSEGVPLALMEAMAAGLPVVAPDLPSVRELVDESVGRLVGVRGSEGFARALAELAVDARLRRELGSAGRRRISERFDVRERVAAFADLYRKLTRDPVAR